VQSSVVENIQVETHKCLLFAAVHNMENICQEAF